MSLERLLRKSCVDYSTVCHERVLVKSSVHGECLVTLRCDATDVCLERLLLKSSVHLDSCDSIVVDFERVLLKSRVYIGNCWFSSSFRAL